MKPKNQFEKFGALLIKDVVNKELCSFFTHALLRSKFYKNEVTEDYQVKGSLGLLEHEILFETMHERVWPAIENVLEEELLPTYSYARAYTNGNILEKHKDRPSCEISVTVQLARTHHYAWPIYMGGQRFDLAEGDGVIYKGCDIEHWREKCDAPSNYVSGQVFFHFIRKNGPYTEWAYDKRWDQQSDFYTRFRHFALENK